MPKNAKYAQIVIFWQWNRVKLSNRIKPPTQMGDFFSTCAKFTRNLDPWNIWPSMSWGTGQREKRNNRDKIRQLRDEARINQESWPKLFSAFFSHFIASSTCSNFCTWTHISASRLSSQGLQAESTSRHETKICSKLIVALPQQSTFIILCQPLTHPEKIRSKMQRSGQRQSLCFSE